MNIKKVMSFFCLPALLLAGLVSIATSKTNKSAQVRAADLGTFVFDGANGDSTVNNLYAIYTGDKGKDLPSGWESTAFNPVGNDSGTFIDDVLVGNEIKKLRDDCYYIKVTGATVDSVVTVKGTWSNGTDTLTVQEFVRKWTGTNWVEPEVDPVDYGTFVFTGPNADSTATGMYGINETENDLPAGWDTAKFSPVDDESGTFVNGVRVGAEIKKVTSISYYIAVPGTTAGTIATVKGTWTNGIATFTVKDFTRKWNGSKWEMLLCDYDVVSLEDANLPDFPNGDINTEDAPNHGYTSDPALLGKRPGIFGLTNVTQSYAFQFNFETTATMSNWCAIRIGSSGGWGTGHVLMYQFTNQWNDGVLIVSERINDSVYNGHTKEVRTNIEGGQHVLECGAIKVFGEDNLYFVYFKNDGAIAFSDYWELSEGQRSTKVGIHAPDTCISLSNSIIPEQHEVTLDTEKSTTSALYFNTESDLLPQVHNLDEYFIPVKDGVRLNFKSVTDNKSDYFKKPSANQLYLDLDELDVSPEEGDVLYLGGMFKLAHDINGVLVAYKLNLSNLYVEYDGIAWGELSPKKYAEILEHTKTECIQELEDYVDESLYDETNFAILESIVDSAKDAIADAEYIEDVVAILENAKEQIASSTKTKLQIVEEEVMASDELLPEYLEDYDVVTTTDFSAVGDFVFLAKDKEGYHSGGYDDTTSRFITSDTNLDGNLIFQFNYSSTNPASREYGSQVFIRMRTDDASNAYRFDIATDVDGNSGVAIAVLQNDVGTQRILYDANFQANTEYKIECGAIDLEGYARTLLFIKINDVMVLKQIVNSFANQGPIVRISDSYTQEDEVARFSAIEEGTTKKNNNPTLLGRLILDESSNKNNLYATLKTNALPQGAKLFPLETGAFTINGQEVNTWRSETNVTKYDDNKYRLDFNSAELADGTVVRVGGYFSYIDSELIKSGYRFFDAEFVYHADTDSWTQNVPTDRETILYEAKETLNNYANLSNYSAANQENIASIVEEYLSKIEAAETEQINAVLAEALALIDAIPTLLDEAKAAAKSELASYRSADLYRDEEKAELSEILQKAYADIDAALTQEEISSIVAKAKSDIDQIKTAEQRDAEDLSAKKLSGKAEVTALSGKLEMSRYSSENQEVLTALTYKALEDIEKATSLGEIDQIVAKYKSDIIAVETKDGSTFNGESYVGGDSSQEESGKESEDGGNNKENHENEEKGFFGRIWEGIKNFFKGIGDFFKNLFSRN